MKVCVSVDMDTYREYQSLVDPGGDADGPSFYDDGIPRFLDLFDECGIRATFFMIGRDADIPSNRKRVREIAARGHEVANHSHTHPYNFRSLTRDEKRLEIEQADAAIADILGERPVGFRTPSLDVDTEVLELLAERDYLYDSSLFPGPFLWAFMLYGKIFVRHAHYQLGSLTAPLAPSQPYVPSHTKLHRRAAPTARGVSSLVEIPVSIVPVVGVPFYGTLMRMLGKRVFDMSLRAFGRRKRGLSYGLHLLDLVRLDGSALEVSLRNTPGVGLPFERRLDFTQHVMRQLSKAGESVPIRELASDYRGELGMD
jgi:peptidoglycan/xylan/chitin deacetylase (PgdA/CDA1 family)